MIDEGDYSMSYIDVIDESKYYKMGETIIKANEKINFSIEKGEVAVMMSGSFFSFTIWFLI